MIIIIIIVVLILVLGGGYYWMSTRPVDCQVSAWAPWGRCSKECDGGIVTRTRTITTQPKNNGKACPSLTDTSSCNTQPCPINCVGDWTSWGACEGSCGMGKSKRYYKVQTAAANNGVACPFTNNATEEKECDTLKACVVLPPPIETIIKPIMPETYPTTHYVFRIHNTWDGGFFILYHTADWDVINKTITQNIINDLNNKKSFKITNVYALNNIEESLTDMNNTALPSVFNITEVSHPADQPNSYTYVTVKFTPAIRLREHKVISIIV